MGMQTCANCDCTFDCSSCARPCEFCEGAPDIRQRDSSDADHARAFMFELLSVCERFGVKMMYTDLNNSGAQRINFASDKYTLSFQTAKRVSKSWRVSPISIKSEILCLEIPMNEEDE